MPLISTPTPPYDSAPRARRHTWLTVGGGAVLVPLTTAIWFAYTGTNPISEGTLFGNSCIFILGIGILPALLFAMLREPVMRRLFSRISRLPTRKGRAVTLLAGTLLVVLSYETIAASLFGVFMWPDGMSIGQFMTGESNLITGIVRIFFMFGSPWRLAALVAAWYVNRDLLPGAKSPLISVPLAR